jgi:hypothetical protein
MNYKWGLKLTEGQQSHGYVQVFETTAEDINIRAIINYFPKLNEFGENKICSVTVTYACKKINITDSFFHSINDDILKLIQNEENQKFEPSLKKFEIMILQNFLVEELPVMEYFSHGDYSVVN